MLIDVLVNSVKVYEEYMAVYLNFVEGCETVNYKERGSGPPKPAPGSDIEFSGVPSAHNPNRFFPLEGRVGLCAFFLFAFAFSSVREMLALFLTAWYGVLSSRLHPVLCFAFHKE